MAKKQKKRKKAGKQKLKVGIALSGGAVRGMSHIGILKALERNSIPIDIIAGTSIGALIGALYASGVKLNELEVMAKTTKWKNLIDFTIPKTGFIAGKRIEKYLKGIIGNKKFEDLKIPLSIVATEINRGEKVVFNQGELIKAIRASISMPGVFEPVVDKDSVLLDGGLVDPIPVDIVKEMGADIVVAIDLTIDIKQINLPEVEKEESAFTEYFEKKLISTELGYLRNFLKKKKLKLPLFVKKFLKPKKIVRVIFGKEAPNIIKYRIRSMDILGNQFAKEKLKYPYVDVIIKPIFESVKWTEFDRTDDIMRAGEIAAEEAIPKIKKLVYENQ
ncbi:patatin-like phospholipase family protein [Candidatus Woesearchaeota archaeon]|nr:patatin-like phospholipase family protein [Candidatus Woesearchaeota archaeon]